MIVCDNCGKSNMPTRKYCIRCGRSLLKKDIKPKKKAESLVPETGTITTAASLAEKEAKATAESPPKPVEEEDHWVRPSEVAKDRVRTTTGGRQISEMEKAKAAFKRAESVGIDEEGSGVIETRMLRASEVKELMEGPSMITPEEDSQPPSPSIDVSHIEETPTPAVPKPEEIEQRILGSMSAYVSDSAEASAWEQAVEEAIQIEPEDSRPPSDDVTVSSAKYASAVPGAEDETEPTPPPVSPKPSETSESELEYELGDQVTTCPNCGEVINIDMFEYPNHVYNSMAEARVKQVRFFIVQGKYENAIELVRIARALYKKTGDQKGLAEVDKMVDSLAKRS